jgi:hypothetical protein
MEQGLLSPFAAWESFYVILGSSAAALTGLQFVVIALAAESTTSTSMRAAQAWGTPTVVHFGAVLLIAALLSAPWHGTSIVSGAVAAAAVAGLAYTCFVLRRARQQTEYEPVLEDWISHIILPLAAYATLLVAGIVLPRHVTISLFVVGGAVLLLLFVGIHNAWDAVTYIALLQRRKRSDADKPSG